MSMELYNEKKTCSLTFSCRDLDTADGLPVMNGAAIANVVYLRVYSDRTRQRHNDGVKHNALDLEHMLVNRSIQTGRVASKIYTIETPSI